MAALQYEDLHFSVGETLLKFTSEDPEVISQALIGAALYCPDREWVEAVAIVMADRQIVQIQRAVILAFAHLARRFGTLHVEPVAAVLSRFQAVPELAAALEDARDDFSQFLQKPEGLKTLLVLSKS